MGVSQRPNAPAPAGCPGGVTGSGFGVSTFAELKRRALLELQRRRSKGDVADFETLQLTAGSLAGFMAVLTISAWLTGRRKQWSTLFYATTCIVAWVIRVTKPENLQLAAAIAAECMKFDFPHFGRAQEAVKKADGKQGAGKVAVVKPAPGSSVAANTAAGKRKVVDSRQGKGSAATPSPGSRSASPSSQAMPFDPLGLHAKRKERSTSCGGYSGLAVISRRLQPPPTAVPAAVTAMAPEAKGVDEAVAVPVAVLAAAAAAAVPVQGAQPAASMEQASGVGGTVDPQPSLKVAEDCPVAPLVTEAERLRREVTRLCSQLESLQRQAKQQEAALPALKQEGRPESDGSAATAESTTDATKQVARESTSSTTASGASDAGSAEADEEVRPRRARPHSKTVGEELPLSWKRSFSDGHLQELERALAWEEEDMEEAGANAATPAFGGMGGTEFQAAPCSHATSDPAQRGAAGVITVASLFQLQQAQQAQQPGMIQGGMGYSPPPAVPLGLRQARGSGSLMMPMRRGGVWLSEACDLVSAMRAAEEMQCQVMFPHLDRAVYFNEQYHD